MPPVDVIGWTSSGAVRLLDQTLLPAEIRHLELDTTDDVIEAIQALRVRGAPLIGVAAAMGLAAAAARQLARPGSAPTPGASPKFTNPERGLTTPGASPGSPGLTRDWFER